MKRAIILMMDSVGIGYSHDADKYGDVGSNTLLHIIKKYPQINIDNLASLGIIHSLKASSAEANQAILPSVALNPHAIYGYGVEISNGKDTPSGHWELMGCPVLFDWGYFHDTPVFPPQLLETILKKANLEDSLGNCISSGTVILDEFGEEHIKTGKPIFYTSADSVFQIAAHEEHFGLEKLYTLCKIAREELYQYNIGRVIARPFIGEKKGEFKRTGNRKDYSIKPHEKTLLDVAVENGKRVVSIGKIADIFADQGISKSIKSSTLKNLYDDTLKTVKEEKEASIIFTNFVDFDSEYGHRRDVKGYKEALEYFSNRLPEVLNILSDEDLLVIVADHGNDPTWTGTDHTREHVPFLLYNKNFKNKDIGRRETFSDLSQSIASFLNLPTLKHGKSFL
ncbi:MAG: phosphopentomutase [Alphaproteobacteria bacterium]|jgi:phosphopentomutase|nr:phosphopentomutase [Alphaproteobacteria bacterium]